MGFRSPAMHRNFEWMHDLEMRYDCSSFDTDPFEPLPDGIGTIFPLWVVNRNATHAFVELPYTLTQDFTLFEILRETSIDIWKRKVDWIAEQGGMVLLNTHPDYMAPDGHPPGGEEYPIAHYTELLRYIRERYEGRYWHALPAEVADYHASIYPVEQELAETARHLGHQAFRVCMPTYSFYESDGRVRRYAETLTRRGHHVDVISLNKGGKPRREIMNGVHVHRIQRRTRNEHGIVPYLLKMLLFLLRSGILISLWHLRHRYQLVHVHNIPDFEVFAALLPRATGAKVILDIHDLVPELFRDKFDKTEHSWTYKWVCAIEKLSTRFAHHIIVSNHLWTERLAARGVPAYKCSVYLNCPDPRLFHTLKGNNHSNGEMTIVYPGTLNHHQGLDLAVDAFPGVVAEIPEARLDIYGEGPARDDLIARVETLNLVGKVRFHETIPLERVPAVMASATCGVVPKRADGFGNEAFSTKILEFMAMGIPVIVSGTKIDRYYFNDSVVLFFEPGNEADLAQKMLRMLRDHDLRAALVQRSQPFIAEFSWDRKEADYIDLIDRLVKPENTPGKSSVSCR